MNNPKPYNEIKEPHGEIFDVIFERTLAYLEKERGSWDELLSLRDGKGVRKREKKMSNSKKIIQKI